MIKATPIISPFPVDAFLRPTVAEQCDIALTKCKQERAGESSKSPGGKCEIPVHVGLFFDGTNNNLERDRNGKRTPVPPPKNKKDERPPLRSRALPSEEASHSNVARLFAAYPRVKQPSGYFRYYIAGVGTPFDEIGEKTESREGKAFGFGGKPRIIWAIFQVFASILATRTGLAGKNFYGPEQVLKYVKDYDSRVGTTEDHGRRPATTITHISWFKPHLALLAAEMAKTPKPEIPYLSLDVFGFSRGAAEAVAFCHLFNDLLANGNLVGIPATINFLGVFDTVASVGVSASVAQTLPVPDFIANGHRDWAKSLLHPLPSCVLKGLHCIAAHEQRMNFPVTVLEGNPQVKQVYFPGVHSDVGGGYGPGESGKCRGGQSAMLSQIPLAYMFREARAASVPFTPFEELEPRDQIDFEVSETLASAWEAYSVALGKEGNLLTKHMELYYRWRAARLKTLETTVTFKAASPQAQQDLRESNEMLAGDIGALKLRRSPPPIVVSTDAVSPRLSPTEIAGMSQWQSKRANLQTPVELDEWEKWALGIFENPKPLPENVMRFFDDYVHDSLAGFYMAGEVTEYDKRLKVESVMATAEKGGVQSLSRFDRRVYQVTKKSEAVLAKKAAGEALSAEEERLALEAEYDTPYPLMTDDDTPDMRSTLILTQTSTRREGGGYFLRRGYFPHVGMIFFRRSKYEQQLEQMPSAQTTLPIKATDEIVYEAVWFDDGQMAFNEPRRPVDDTKINKMSNMV